MSETNASTRADVPDEWKTVAEAAAALGISERAVQRRCHSGKLRARLVPTKTGQAWEIKAASLASASTRGADTSDATASTLPTATPEETTATTPEAATLPTQTTEATPTPPTVGADTSDARVLAAENAVLREALQRERENSDQWRAQVEAANRQAAESAAALREYLKLSAKQLSGDGMGQIGTENARAQDAPETPKTGAAGIVSGAQKNAPERAPAREFARTLRRLLGIR